MNNEIIETLSKTDNEGTRAPYWLILDPQQNMTCDIHYLNSQISGPFFCRKDAQKYLDARPHAYSKRAKVFCCSGHFSHKYNRLCDEIGM